MGTREFQRARLAAPLSAALIAGCASAGVEPGRIEVSSDPAGAEVYVMGERAGVTPLVLEQARIFPLTYPSTKQALYGTVELRKSGCQPATRTVSTRAVARGLHVTLDCADASPTPGPNLADPALSATPAAPKPGVEQRLRQVHDLLQQGLITEQEAHEARMRILNAL